MRSTRERWVFRPRRRRPTTTATAIRSRRGAATHEELLRLAAVLHDHAGTQLELIIPGCLNGFTDDEIDLMAGMSSAADRPLNWNVLGVAPGGNHERQLDAGSRAAAKGARVVALTLPQGMRIRLSFHSGFVLDGLPGWRETFALPIEERMRALSDPDTRRRLDANAHSPEAGVLAGLARWERLEIAEGFTDDTRRLEGTRIGDIARDRQADAFDVLCDVVIADGLRTGLRPDFGGPEPDEVWKMRAAVSARLARDRRWLRRRRAPRHDVGRELLDVRCRGRRTQRPPRPGRSGAPADRSARAALRRP